MKILVNNGRLQNHYRQGFHMEVKCVANRVRAAFLFQVEMANLCQGVNPGIRSTGPEDPGCFTAESSNRFFQRLLHAKTVFLTLPADKTGTIIFNNYFITCHILIVFRY